MVGTSNGHSLRRVVRDIALAAVSPRQALDAARAPARARPCRLALLEEVAHASRSVPVPDRAVGLCVDEGLRPVPGRQEIVDAVAARHADLARLTLHAVPMGATQCPQLASALPDRRGEPSDPEDLQALRTGKEVVLAEPGAMDVTVPILVQDGAPTAVAGVTLRTDGGAGRDVVVSRARRIAEELASEIRSAGKPLW
jgi:hypothetical protein